MAALILLGKWFDYLKQQKVYDNSRIIIASDHGWYLNSKLKNNFVLPNGATLIMFNSLLMVKDFLDDTTLTDTEIKTDNVFMTQADVPYLASKDITNAVNPFTQSPLFHDKVDGIKITTVAKWEGTDFRKYKWAIHSNQWLHVHDNIFDPGNWEKAEK
jgi:CTP:phosphocholine cytidylyltransferase-like protein